MLDAWYAVHGDDEKPLQSLFTALASAGDDEGRKVAVGLLLGDARDRSAYPRVTRAVERASPDARYRLHRAALAGCRLRNDESRAAQLQRQIHAEGLEALRPAATVRGRMVPFANGREPSTELDALLELLGDEYEPHLRALPYAFEGDAAAEDGVRLVRPELGRVVAFDGALRHGGEPVTKGVRYIIAAFLWVSND